MRPYGRILFFHVFDLGLWSGFQGVHEKENALFFMHARRALRLGRARRMTALHMAINKIKLTCLVLSIALAFSLFGATRVKAKPFVKWAGGKGQLLEQLEALLPGDIADREGLVYVEPFVGGGAMLFHMLAKYPNIERAIINDLNEDLVTCYRVVKTNPEQLVAELRELQNDFWGRDDEASRKAMYLEKRARYNSRVAGDVETAALFIFLNRTCFNGLYRVNSKGAFNVPFGKAVKPLICDEETIRADSMLLQKVEIMCGDFSIVANALSCNAFAYFDPPYRPLSQTAAFTAYSKEGFDDNEQRRLAGFCRELDKAGHQWLLSNSDPRNTNPDDMFFDELYAGFDIKRVRASRAINSKSNGRGKINELAIRNYME